MSREGDYLVLRINLKENHGKSKTGKTDIIASTNGFVSAPNDPNVKVSINICSKPEKA